MRKSRLRTFGYLAAAVLAGTSLSAAAKRVELDQRIGGVADAESQRVGGSAKLAQWLNQNPWDNWNNWPNY